MLTSALKVFVISKFSMGIHTITRPLLLYDGRGLVVVKAIVYATAADAVASSLVTLTAVSAFAVPASNVRDVVSESTDEEP